MDAKRRYWLLWAFVPALLATLLWLWVRSPIPEIDPHTAGALEAAADQWWKPGGPNRTIPEADWPPELRRLRPEAVRVSSEGVFIKFGSFYVEEWGVFVLPRASGYRPERRGDPSFRLLRGRVYRYDIVG